MFTNKRTCVCCRTSKRIYCFFKDEIHCSVCINKFKASQFDLSKLADDLRHAKTIYDKVLAYDWLL